MNKPAGILLLILALVIGIVPVLTDCLAHGRSMTTADGMSAPMKCHWTAVAEIGAALPLGLAGVLLAASRRKETRGMLSLLVVGTATVVILFPTVLIGTCANSMMPCNLVEKPLLIFCGILAIAAGLTGFAGSRSLRETAG
jgi:hypothetical protein